MQTDDEYKRTQKEIQRLVENASDEGTAIAQKRHYIDNAANHTYTDALYAKAKELTNG